MIENIFDAPIPESSQDGVFCFGVLHECPDEYHLPNIEKMLTWLKPNGQLVMRCKSKLVVNKHPVQRHAVTYSYEKYLGQGLWNKERINQFTQQLVAFTGVEQSIATNNNLGGLLGLD